MTSRPAFNQSHCAKSELNGQLVQGHLCPSHFAAVSTAAVCFCFCVVVVLFVIVWGFVVLFGWLVGWLVVFFFFFFFFWGGGGVVCVLFLGWWCLFLVLFCCCCCCRFVRFDLNTEKAK